jgi:hypothetical protein
VADPEDICFRQLLSRMQCFNKQTLRDFSFSAVIGLWMPKCWQPPVWELIEF